MSNELYRDFIDRKADSIINSLGGTITPAPANAELYRDFLDRKFNDVITAITDMSTGSVLSGNTIPDNNDGDNNDIYVQYDVTYTVIALYVKLNDIWRTISFSGNNHAYSTTEHVIGTWIDGSPVYEKTIVLSSELAIQANSWEATSEPTSGIASLIDLILLSNTGTFYVGYGAIDYGNYIRLYNLRRDAEIRVKTFIIRYTKITH